MISDTSIGQLIIGGDFNDILSKCRNTIEKFDKPVYGLKQLMKYFKLIDIWKDKNPDKTQFTWRRKGKNEATRIDFFLVQEAIKLRCFSSDIRPVIIKCTDHNAISLKIKTSRDDKGRGYWKLNNSILENENYSKKISNLIESYMVKRTSASDIGLLWDNFKIEVRDLTINHCKALAKQNKNEINLLETKLKQLYEKEDENINKTDENANMKIVKIENKLEKLYVKKAKGAQIRSRVKWIEQGGKCIIFLRSRKNATNKKDNIRTHRLKR